MNIVLLHQPQWAKASISSLLFWILIEKLRIPCIISNKMPLLIHAYAKYFPNSNLLSNSLAHRNKLKHYLVADFLSKQQTEL